MPRNSDNPARPGQGLIARVALHRPNATASPQRRQWHTAASGQPNHRTMHDARRRCREATHRVRWAIERELSQLPFYTGTGELLSVGRRPVNTGSHGGGQDSCVQIEQHGPTWPWLPRIQRVSCPDS